jgi:MFS family permease
MERRSVEQQSGGAPPGQIAPGDRMGLARRALGAPRKYVRPWYLAYLLLGMVTAGLLPVLLPLLVEAISHSLATVAYVIGAYNFGLLTSPLWGRLAERRKLYRELFVGSFLLAALAIAALPVLHGLPGWMASAFAIGAGSGGAATLATLFIVDFAPRPEWEPRIGWLQSFNAAGQVVGLLLAAALSGGHFTAALWVAAAILLPAMLAGGIGLPLSRTARPSDAYRRHLHAHLDIRALAIFPKLNLPSGVALHFHHLNFHGLRRLPLAVGTPFGRFLLSWFVLALAVAAFFTYFPLMLADSYDIAADVSAMIYALATAVGVGLYIATSHLASRYGASRVYRAGLVLRMAGFALLLAPFLTPMAHDELLGAAGFVLIVVAWPVLSVSGTDLAARLTPFSEGAAVGLLNAALALATAIGTIISGPLVHHWGYGTVPVTALAGLAVSLLLGVDRQPPSGEKPNA